MFLDGRLKSVSGTALFGSGSTTYDYGFDSSGDPYVKESPPSGGYTYRVTDWLGRPIRSTTPGYNGARIAQVFTYDGTTGRLMKKQTLTADSSDEAGTANLSSPLLYEYDVMGRIKRECVDANENESIDLDGSDRITEYDYSVSTTSLNIANAVGGNCSATWSKIDVFTYPDSGSANRLRLGSQLEQLNGYATYQGSAYTIYPKASIVRNALSANDGSDDATTAKVTVTKLIPSWAGVVTETTYPGVSAKDTVTSVNGFPTQSISTSGVQTTNIYDPYGRLFQSQGREDLVSEYTYYPGTSAVKNLRNYNLRPSVIGSEWKQLTYDAAGRLAKSERNEVGHWRQECYDYDQRGNLRHVWGSGTTPVEYIYDNYNRKTEMHLYHNSDSTDWSASSWPTGATADVTHWTYDMTTGLVKSKTSPNAAHSVSFTYNGNNQLVTRTWARGVVTQYDYYDGSDPTNGVRGQLKEISYPGSTTSGHQVATQPVSYTYFRHGAVHTVTDQGLGTDVRTFTYRPQDLQLSQETLPDFFGSNQKKLAYKYEDGTHAFGDTSVAGRLAGFEFGKSTNE
jgi:YD repeat-containing protein